MQGKGFHVKRNRHAGVEDLWYKTVHDANRTSTTVPSACHGRGSRWRARYVDHDGREHTKQFPIKAHAHMQIHARRTSLIRLKMHLHIADRRERSFDVLCGHSRGRGPTHRATGNRPDADKSVRQLGCDDI